MKPGPRARPLAERFLEKIEAGEPDLCWPWRGRPDSDGYGRFQVGRTSRLAHRVAYELLVGPIPDGLLVRHTCDNPPCVNPRHLMLGTDLDNMRDMYARGRAPNRRGEAHPRAKLTPDAVRDIRRSTEPVAVLAGRYGVSAGAVWFARTGVTWSDVVD